MRNGLYLRDGYAVTLALRNARLCACAAYGKMPAFYIRSRSHSIIATFTASGAVSVLLSREIAGNFIVLCYIQSSEPDDHICFHRDRVYAIIIASSIEKRRILLLLCQENEQNDQFVIYNLFLNYKSAFLETRMIFREIFYKWKLVFLAL